MTNIDANIVMRNAYSDSRSPAKKYAMTTNNIGSKISPGI